jgi:hypothetical protein
MRSEAAEWPGYTGYREPTWSAPVNNPAALSLFQIFTS